jgi:hypothetical protein
LKGAFGAHVGTPRVSAPEPRLHFALAECPTGVRFAKNPLETPHTSNGTVLAERASVLRLGDVLWADCLRALRRAGFVCTAESPTAVMLVNAGRAVLLPRMPALDEMVLLATLRATRLSAEEFVELLRE